MRVRLGWGVLRDYSDQDNRGHTFCQYAHQMFQTEAEAEDYGKSVIGHPYQVVEVFIRVPDPSN